MTRLTALALAAVLASAVPAAGQARDPLTGQLAIVVVPLRNADADEVVRIVTAVYGNTIPFRIVADRRTNSVIVVARAATKDDVLGLVDKLDARK